MTFTALACTLVLAISPVPVGSQTNTAEIVGVVKDATGAVIAGVTVTAINSDTGTVLARTTAADGRFSLPALRVGAWTLSLRMPGFAVQTRTVVVSLGQSV